MKRLSETMEFSSEGERKLADLLASAERYSPNPLEKRRIGVQVHASRRRSGRARPWQPVVAVGLLFAGTAAAATLGHRIWTERTAQLTEAPPRTPTLRPRPAARNASSQPTLAPASPVVQTAPTTEVLAPPRDPENVAPHRAASANHRPSTKKARAHTPHTEDPTRVAEALRALRKEGDANRAQALLTEYMKDNPKGALSEEALALAIEAAHARKDPIAKTYARRYLNRYPAGRHRPLAQRVLAD